MTNLTLIFIIKTFISNLNLGENMKIKSSIHLFILFFLNSIFAEIVVDISGTIQNLGEQPIQDAKILLSNKSYSVSSDKDGYFEIILEETAINNIPKNTSMSPYFEGIRFHYDNPMNQNASLEFYNLTGKLLFSRAIQTGSGVIDLNNELASLSSNMGILVYKTGNKKFAYKTIVNSQKISVTEIKTGSSSNSNIFERSFKRDFIDTLKVLLDNEIKFTMLLSSYFEGSLIITLDIIPEIYTAKVMETPDYYQLDDAYGGFTDGGAVFCGPTTASNSLMWLAKNGYPDLTDGYTDEKYAQFKMIETLGSDGYMGLGSGGVGPNGICYGVNKYFNAKGVEYKSMKYQGWRSVSSSYYTGVTTPSMEWFKRGLMGTGSVWLNFGWYTYSSSSNTYTRNGGHWMTLVGFGWDGTSEVPNCLIVHDPWTGNTFNNYRDMTKITSGTLSGNYTGLPKSASGYYKYWTGSKYGIIDGVIVLTIE